LNKRRLNRPIDWVKADQNRNKLCEGRAQDAICPLDPKAYVALAWNRTADVP
jgi:hypothetical protein